MPVSSNIMTPGMHVNPAFLPTQDVSTTINYFAFIFLLAGASGNHLYNIVLTDSL